MLLAIFAGIVLLGVLLLALGIRGRRVDERPACRGCGFDLGGLEQAGRCPECGRELGGVAGKKGIRLGRRRRSRTAMAAGVLLAILGAGAGGAILWGRASSFKWNTVKPAWVLLREVRPPSPDPGALKELAHRMAYDTLGPGAARDLVRRALEVQADDSVHWDSRFLWATIIETGRARGLVSEEEWGSYAQHAGAARVRLSASLVRRHGRLYVLPNLAYRAGRGGLSTTIGRRFHIDGLTFAGHEVAIPEDWEGNQIFGLAQLGITGGVGPGMMPVPEASGIAHVELLVTETVEDSALPAGKQELARWTRQLAADVDTSKVAIDDHYPEPGPEGWARVGRQVDPGAWQPMQTMGDPPPVSRREDAR
jgi:hypothetical protein